MRKYSVADMRRAERLARLEVNITFPDSFGPPQVMHATSSCMAVFGPHVRTLTRVDGSLVSGRAIGRGQTEVDALTDLFEELARRNGYEAVVVLAPDDEMTGQLYVPVDAGPTEATIFRPAGTYQPV